MSNFAAVCVKPRKEIILEDDTSSFYLWSEIWIYEPTELRIKYLIERDASIE